jgi:DGQHR domain-containing protein
MAARSRSALLSVSQWLPTWDTATWGKNRPKPPAKFYVGSMSLKVLRGLSGVRTRTIEDRRANAASAGYQRTHDEDRLKKIGRYVEYGFPLSSERSLKPEQHTELINPGWLPTAILVNVIGRSVLRPRGGKDRSVEADHLVSIVHENGLSFLDYPQDTVIEREQFLPPLEIIDGQHRLLASDSVPTLSEDYEVPIVVFDNLPLNWQAYLFWVINVEPKRINTSLAFDLYPDLRDQDWLQRGESIKIYQQHRSQELAEVLWRHPQSPWKDRVELFGKRADGHVSNAAVIRSLMATFVRPWPKTTGTSEEISRLGGLFGSIDRGGESYVIRWRRPEQAAFLLLAWSAMKDAVAKTSVAWKEDLVRQAKAAGNASADPAFSGPYTLLGTDQGFRAVCFAFNALSQLQHANIGLLDIESPEGDSEPTDESVSQAIVRLSAYPKLTSFLVDGARALADGVDWRTSSAPGLDRDVQVRQAQYRGSSGYSALNRATLLAANSSKSSLVSAAAQQAIELQGWN